MMGEKLRHIVCIKKIHFPFLEVGLNLHIPLEISWIIDEEIPDFFEVEFPVKYTNYLGIFLLSHFANCSDK